MWQIQALHPLPVPGHSLGPVDARTAQAAPRLKVAVAAAAVGAYEGAVLAVGAIATLGLAPVADPARVAARTLAGDMVTGMPVAARRTAVAAALAIETGGARLVALGSVPAGLARQAAALSYRARLLALTLATPAATAQAVEAGGARLATVLAAVARLAGTRAVHRVAAAAEALAVAIAARAERTLAALTAAALLLAGRRVAGALVVAAAAPPACVAQAGAGLWVAARRGAAVARAGALRAPPAGLTAARAAPRVARAMLALARMLAARAPAPRVTSTLACHVLALPVWVAATQLLAVGAPELARALGVAVGTEVAVAAAALARPHAHLVLRARRVAFAHRNPTLVPLLPPASAARGHLGAASRGRTSERNAPPPAPICSGLLCSLLTDSLPLHLCSCPRGVVTEVLPGNVSGSGGLPQTDLTAKNFPAQNRHPISPNSFVSSSHSH